MENRRNFVMKIAAGMTASGFVTNPEKSIANQIPIKNVFIHHVFFWLKEPDNAEARTRFENGLQLLITIPQIQSSHVGVPVKSNREVVDDSFTYSYIAFFKNREDQAIYQTHPTHLQFIEDCQTLWKKVIVYDAMD